MGTPELVSVIITTRNSARTLKRCLDSIKLQSYPTIETIVVDNRSVDGTQEIAIAGGARVITAGPERCAQRNVGIGVAQGEYVFIADSDMALTKDVIAECVDRIQRVKAVIVPEISHGEGFWSACKAFERSFYVGDTAVSAARFFRKRDILQAGGYDEMMLGGEDWDISMRIAGEDGLAFTNALIHHDEGRLQLLQTFAKKRYYGAGVRLFLKKHGRKGWSRVGPGRASIFSRPGRLVAHPFLSAGMILLKAVEATGVLLGMLRARPDTINRVYRA